MDRDRAYGRPGVRAMGKAVTVPAVIGHAFWGQTNAARDRSFQIMLSATDHKWASC